MFYAAVLCAFMCAHERISLVMSVKYMCVWALHECMKNIWARCIDQVHTSMHVCICKYANAHNIRMCMLVFTVWMRIAIIVS